MEFIDIDPFCNKLNIQLLANNTITYKKKKCVFEIEDKANGLLKIKTIQNKKIPIK